MSKPPRPRYRHSVVGDGTTFRERGDYAPPDFVRLVEIARSRLVDVAKLGITREEGDFGGTLVELSALLGHALGVYQDQYSREAFLSTATTRRSLVRHARRLAYTPDPGLSATGFAAMTIGDGLQGVVPQGFAMASSPMGEVKAQTFETLNDLEVDAARNVALPAQRRRPATVTFSDGNTQIRLASVGLQLEPGQPALLLREPSTWLPVRILSSTEQGDETVVLVRLEPGTAEPLAAPASDYRFLAKPSLQVQLFGAGADPLQFPPDEIQKRGGYSAPGAAGAKTYGYRVTKEDGTDTYDCNDVYLDLPSSEPLVGAPVWVSMSGDAHVLQVAGQESVNVAFVRGERVSISVATPGEGNTIVMARQTQLFENNISSTTTALRLSDQSGSEVARSAIALPAPVIAGWELDAPVVPDEPNPTMLEAPLDLAADFGQMRPGSHACFAKLDGSFHQVIEVRRITKLATGRTTIEWVPVTDDPPNGWTLDNLQVLGNVARISHGETVEEILGGSDGTTPFYRFVLKKPFVTQLPSVDGGAPNVEVRVSDVAWQRVEDFHHSSAEHRHYQIEVDDQQQATVVLGDGRQGAIPPSGKKHILANYRFGLGLEGNVSAGQISRIKKSHPLVDRAFNPTATVGGAAPAELDDLQVQATQFIRTFDRAVSVQDHANVALLYPGIARAAARLTGNGLQVIVANGDGVAPVELTAAVKTYLEARRDNDLRLTVTSPVPVDIYLSLEIEYDPAHLAENVRLGVQAALLDQEPGTPGLFAFAGRLLGQAAHRSHVYDRVSAVPGVSFVRVTRFALADESTAYDLLRVTRDQWLRLEPHHLDLQLVPGGEE